MNGHTRFWNAWLALPDKDAEALCTRDGSDSPSSVSTNISEHAYPSDAHSTGFNPRAESGMQHHATTNISVTNSYAAKAFLARLPALHQELFRVPESGGTVLCTDDIARAALQSFMGVQQQSPRQAPDGHEGSTGSVCSPEVQDRDNNLNADIKRPISFLEDVYQSKESHQRSSADRIEDKKESKESETHDFVSQFGKSDSESDGFDVNEEALPCTRKIEEASVTSQHSSQQYGDRRAQPFDLEATGSTAQMSFPVKKNETYLTSLEGGVFFRKLLYVYSTVRPLHI